MLGFFFKVYFISHFWPIFFCAILGLFCPLLKLDIQSSSKALSLLAHVLECSVKFSFFKVWTKQCEDSWYFWWYYEDRSSETFLLLQRCLQYWRSWTTTLSLWLWHWRVACRRQQIRKQQASQPTMGLRSSALCASASHMMSGRGHFGSTVLALSLS